MKKNLIELEELEERFEMAAEGGSCEDKCSIGHGGDGPGGGNGGDTDIEVDVQR